MPDDVMSDEELDELERLEKAATPGPWTWRSTKEHPEDFEPDANPEAQLLSVSDDYAPEGQKNDLDSWPMPVLTAECRGDEGIMPEEKDQRLIAAARNALPKLLAMLRRERARHAEGRDALSQALTALHELNDACGQEIAEYQAPDSVQRVLGLNGYEGVARPAPAAPEAPEGLAEENARLRKVLGEVKATAEGHHADQPHHVLLHSLTVDIPSIIDAATRADGPSGEDLSDLVIGAAEQRTRCACSFEHPPHDFCDGNPGAKFGVAALSGNGAESRSAIPEGLAKELHDAAMNMPFDKMRLNFCPEHLREYYRDGHRDARHAVAEMLLTHPKLQGTAGETIQDCGTSSPSRP